MKNNEIMTDNEKIINGLNKLGYDCFINNNTIKLSRDGFTKTMPLNNTIKLLYDKLAPMKINELIQYLVSTHMMAKDIKDGKFDNAEPILFSEFVDLIKHKLSYKIYDDGVDWYSTNLLDSVVDVRKELLVRYFNLTNKEIKNISNINGRFKALIFPILAKILNQIDMEWYNDVKDIINEVNSKCTNIKTDIDSEIKFVDEYSKNKIIELQLKNTRK